MKHCLHISIYINILMSNMTGVEDYNKELQNLCEVPEVYGAHSHVVLQTGSLRPESGLTQNVRLPLLRGSALSVGGRLCCRWAPSPRWTKVMRIVIQWQTHKHGSKSMPFFYCALDNYRCVCVCVHTHSASPSTILYICTLVILKQPFAQIIQVKVILM